jgi:hypothetical protein
LTAVCDNAEPISNGIDPSARIRDLRIIIGRTAITPEPARNTNIAQESRFEMRRVAGLFGQS